MDFMLGEGLLERDVVASLQDHMDKSEGPNSRKPLYDICEVFSPPRTSARARARNLRGGWSLDIDHVCPEKWLGVECHFHNLVICNVIGWRMPAS